MAKDDDFFEIAQDIGEEESSVIICPICGKGHVCKKGEFFVVVCPVCKKVHACEIRYEDYDKNGHKGTKICNFCMQICYNHEKNIKDIKNHENINKIEAVCLKCSDKNYKEVFDD